ncbi:ATP-binding protein [Pseudomonas sp. AN-1]|uniref:ATP-binding protein n=1 Tax=Pseudomonas sp. AN-1 TaxID=3096605 RepID=UPI002A6A78D1|nr:AAA family ATPase [Pseudomonas sp. AN-1]WPP46446.1 AAA family ATPase [Pseudomonas sp. AN-1]
MHEPVNFPLAAVVGADALKLALCLAAVDPAIGGVLIEGPRGMAKSTLARGVAELLDGGQLVTLPLGATEERIVGTLDLDAALGEGRARFAPGLLARAHGGVLYVDEVNLLADHLVDLLLDVAASGVNHVERDGISHRHAARFVLIGTMNPEEGELRPQLLDRFGLAVVLGGAPLPAERAEIVRRRLDFDRDPQAFRVRWQAAQDQLQARCRQAREQLEAIPLDDTALETIAARCYAAGIDGLRGDLVWLRAARAHAAWRGAQAIAAEDIDAVQDFVLRHRHPHGPAAEPPQQNPGDSAPQREAGGQNDGQRGEQGEGQWGELPAQPLAIGERRAPPRWPKKP